MASLLTTTIATLSSQTSFTLTDGSAVDAAYDIAVIVITNQADANEKAIGVIQSYTGSTKTVALFSDPAVFTMSAGDTVDVLQKIDDRKTISQLTTLTPSESVELVGYGSSQTGKITVSTALNFVRGSVSASFNTLEKIEDGKLGIDGTPTMTGDIDLDGNNLLNQGSTAGILVKQPTEITSTDASWDFDALTRTAIVEGWAGGGAGGGSTATASQGSAGGGGASGGYFRIEIDVSALATRSASITIGAGGTGSSASSGSAGGDTIYQDENVTVTAKGGGGGLTASAAGAGVASGGSGVLGTNGDVNLAGNPGGNSSFTGTSVATNLTASGGNGGISIVGKSGKGQTLFQSTGGSSAGGAATGYASGGGGSVTVAGGANAAGGDGAQGLCKITEYK